MKNWPSSVCVHNRKFGNFDTEMKLSMQEIGDSENDLGIHSWNDVEVRQRKNEAAPSGDELAFSLQKSLPEVPR